MRLRPWIAVVLLAAGMLATGPGALAQPADDAYRAGRFDNGKMWTFDFPPIDYLKETYNFEPDAAWFDNARLGALRIPGCSASFVSPNGLLMTNHHCGRSHVTAVTGEGENLTDDGFYATTLDEERRAPNMLADQLIAITDVTDEVYAALEGMETDAERVNARQETIEAIQTRMAREAGGEDFHVEVISLYNGGRYSAYTFRRYTDVRLVMTPELLLGYYGGDTDNFTYPRYTLDINFFRVYDDDGNPLQTENYFAWSDTGVEEGDLVFAIGNPGSTFRLETVGQLEYRRDVREPAVLDFVESRAGVIDAFIEKNPDHPMTPGLKNVSFSLLNTAKLYGGRVKALNQAMIMARRTDTERQLRQAIEADADLNAQYGSLIDQMAQLQRERIAMGAEYGGFFQITNPNLESATMRRAILAYRYLNEQRSEATGDSELREQLASVPDLPPDMEQGFLTLRMHDFMAYFGPDDDITKQVLQGQSPEKAAQRLLDDSVLSGAETTKEALDNGTLTMDDPAVKAASSFVTRFQDFQSATSGMGAQEQEIASELGRARFEVYGTAIPPDATFSLRLADGLVKGYTYNGTVAPPYTTYYGLFDHYRSYGDGTEWELPERWHNPPATFDYSTPLNFVSTADITGGNSGSPMINRDLEIVGIAFDGNIESLSGDYIFLPERNRCVAVDVRGILEALDEIYDADRIVLELTSQQFVPTEEEADAIRSR